MDHVTEIKTRLGISGVFSEVYSWSCKADKEKKTKGAQIDLVIVRNDRIINLCEMKYSISDYHIKQKDDESLRNKIVALKDASKTRYSVHPVLVTTYGIAEGKYSGIFQGVVVCDDLFAKL